MKQVRLTARQWEIIGLYAGGMSGAEIAEHLFIEPKTVNWHMATMRKTMNVAHTHAVLPIVFEMTPREEYAPKPKSKRSR